MVEQIYDLAIVGGGINGTGIARDAAGRGLSVFLCEQGDLANATSSASTKLIHGGLRYLEYYEFRLVREALQEREVLLRNAPHIIWPLRFVLPHHRGLRSSWLIRAGLFLYDHIGRRSSLPASHSIDLTRETVGKSLKSSFKRGFVYSDCWVDDCRLVVLNAIDAVERGANLRIHTRCISAEKESNTWKLSLRSDAPHAELTVRAKTLINATGPWVSAFLSNALKINAPSAVRLVKGSHIVVPKLFEHAFAYIFQNKDGRVVFAIPYEGDFTLIGTTDVEFQGDPKDATITGDEIDYLCAAMNEYFAKPVERSEIVHTFAGVRPLFDDKSKDAKAASRDYVLELDTTTPSTPLLNVFGGKITTFRRLSEAALERLAIYFPQMGPSWTSNTPLPGGEFTVGQIDEELEAMRTTWPFLTQSHRMRLLRSYGTRAKSILLGVGAREDLGECFGSDLYEKEVIYLMDREWARTEDDILWRRSKLGLRINEKDRARLRQWMQHRLSQPAAPVA